MWAMQVSLLSSGQLALCEPAAEQHALSRPQGTLGLSESHCALAHLQRVQDMLVQAVRSTLLLSVCQLSSLPYSRSTSYHVLP